MSCRFDEKKKKGISYAVSLPQFGKNGRLRASRTLCEECSKMITLGILRQNGRMDISVTNHEVFPSFSGTCNIIQLTTPTYRITYPQHYLVRIQQLAAANTASPGGMPRLSQSMFVLILNQFSRRNLIFVSKTNAERWVVLGNVFL